MPLIATHGGNDSTGTRQVETVVVALIPAFHQVMVEDSEGNRFALTRRTQGIELASLQEGQRVTCIVTPPPCRILSAKA